MTEQDPAERAREFDRLWRDQSLRLGEQDESDRRHRIVPVLAAAIARAAERRKHERRVRRVFDAFAVAAGVAIAVGTADVVHGPATFAGVGDVQALSGVVSLIHNARAQVVDHASLQTGDALTTAPSSRAEVRLSSLVVADIGESSELRVAPPKGSTHRLRLDRGRIDAKVDDHSTVIPKLIVETPDLEVVVTGTIFSVDVANPEPSRAPVTSVTVEKGRVVVRRAGQDIAAVTAGEKWSSESEPAEVGTSAVAASSEPGHREEPRGPAVSNAGAAANAGTLAAENRLFRAAIDARNRGDDHGAIARFSELLSKYPKAVLAGEARVERLLVLVRTGDKAEAAKEARRYLVEYPDGFAAEDAKHFAAQSGDEP